MDGFQSLRCLKKVMDLGVPKKVTDRQTHTHTHTEEKQKTKNNPAAHGQQAWFNSPI